MKKTPNIFNRMVKITCIVVFLQCNFQTQLLAQYSSISLDTCLKLAEQHFQYDAIQKQKASITKENLSSIKTSNYPALSLEGSATTQNIQVGIPVIVPIPGVEYPVASTEIYKTYLQLSQKIYDGSYTAYKKRVEMAEGSISQQQTEIEKYQLKSQITSLYMSVLFLDKQQEVLKQTDSALSVKAAEVGSLVKNGVLIEANKTVIEVELYKIKQSYDELESTRAGAIASLSELTGIQLKSDVQFEMPKTNIGLDKDVSLRPELKLLQLQTEKLAAQSELTRTAVRPKLGVFATGGYGSPGYNFFDTGWNPMWMAGVNLQWPIFDWGNSKHQRSAISTTGEIIKTQQQQLTSQYISQLEKVRFEMEAQQKNMTNDAQIIFLQKSVVDAYDSQMKNGTITSAQYVDEVNKYSQYQLNAEMHQLKLVSAQLNYLIISGK